MHGSASGHLLSGSTYFTTTPYRRSIDYVTDPVHWHDLQACAFRTEPLNEWLEIPAFNEDAVIIPTGRRLAIEGRISKGFGLMPYNLGSITIVPRGYPTCWRLCSSEDFETYVLYPSLPLMASVSEHAFKTCRNRPELVEQVSTADPLVWHLAVAIVGAIRVANVMSRLYVESLTHSLAVHLLHKYSIAPSEPAELQDRLSKRSVQAVIDFVEAHLASDLSLAEIAAAACVSPYHLSRLFRQSTGLTIHQYVISQRLARGKRLLESSELSLAEVAHGVGFSDQSHFTRHFKLRYGCTPGQVRRNSKIVQIPGRDIQDHSKAIM